jgi:protein NRD1
MQIGWAVGFGPTQYADYQIGISVLPISLLTEADRKWMLSAEYGGSGGKEIVTGMVVEEPDIEIGSGPSSKGKLPVNHSENQSNF